MRALLLSSTMFLLAAASCQANFIDNFDAENGGIGQLNYNFFANWTVANANTTGGTVDLIGNGYFDFFPGNGLYVDLDGSGNGVPGLLTTKQVFDVGSYTLSFDLAGSARGVDDHVNVNFGNYSQTFFLPSDQGYTLFTENITLTAPAQLSFQNVEPGNIGAILDNVSVMSSAVPEPNSLILVCFGVLGIVGYSRYREQMAMK